MLMALFAAGVLCACARHVVVKPEIVPTLGQKEWTITSTPRPTPEPALEPGDGERRETP
jgi:hypothetical protein